MTCHDRRLALALVISLLLHAAPFLADSVKVRAVPRPPPIQARLALPPPPPPLAVPDLIVPETAAPAPTPPAPPPKAAKPPPKPGVPMRWENTVRRQLKTLQATGQYYSTEAIAQRLEGDAVVLFVLDEQGNVVAARIQESSGHPLLDRDAVNAVRKLRGLPANAPREAMLPLRFRLRD